ncbi:hypothetical protein DYB38_002056 [Aphanomyces astaci]|uniref:Uncharacterized protein n=1 Tax=Aphanomyces astaci TaxID=112090 RepID=A0A397CES9_APHAT|nr:hypothetical protein DYB38_002056 [Aphanomyces astaci]
MEGWKGKSWTASATYPRDPTGPATEEDPALSADVVSYWKPIPQLVFNNLRMENIENEGWKYMPVLYVDEMGMTSEKLIPLNRSVSTLPLKLSFEPMSYAR